KAKKPPRIMPLWRRSARAVVRVEQPVQMHDEIAHMRVVHGAVGGVLPSVIGLRVIGVDADDVEGLEVAELYSLERGELSPEHEVKQLLLLRAKLCGHVSSFPHAVFENCA